MSLNMHAWVTLRPPTDGKTDTKQRRTRFTRNATSKPISGRTAKSANRVWNPLNHLSSTVTPVRIWSGLPRETLVQTLSHGWPGARAWGPLRGTPPAPGSHGLRSTRRGRGCVDRIVVHPVQLIRVY